MNLRISTGTLSIGLFASLALSFGLCVASPAQKSDHKVVDDGMVIEDVTLISPERSSPLPHASVVIRDGRIAEIAIHLVAGPHAKRIDGHHRFLIPGLIDSHVHAGELAMLDDDAIAAHPELLQAFRAQVPRSFLAFGFTTLVDLNLRSTTLAWFNTARLHPGLFHCGPAVHVVGGYGALQIPRNAGEADAANVVYESARAKDWPTTLDPRDYTPARAVDRVVASGGICLKTFIEPGFGGARHWPVPSDVTLNALREETRRRGLVLVIHANADDTWRAALRAHADVIAHGLWHWPGDQLDSTPPQVAIEAIKAAALAGVGVQPTLQSVYGDESIFDESILNEERLKEALPEVLIRYLKTSEAQAARAATANEYRQAIRQWLGPSAPAPQVVMSIAPKRASAALRIMLEDKVKLLFGSDTPSNDGIGNPPGLNGRFELARWSEAGVPLERILRSATLDNAAAFGFSGKLGSIEVGKQADLLLLRENPLKTISAYDTIEVVFLNGNPIARTSLLPLN